MFSSSCMLSLTYEAIILIEVKLILIQDAERQEAINIGRINILFRIIAFRCNNIILKLSRILKWQVTPKL